MFKEIVGSYTAKFYYQSVVEEARGWGRRGLWVGRLFKRVKYLSVQSMTSWRERV